MNGAENQTDSSMQMRDPVLRVDGLKTYFHTRDGTVRAVDDVSFELARGETLCK